MLKLRHLFNNPDLARMLLVNWDYEAASLRMFQDFRISANAVYPFHRDGETCFLRFCPTSEKQPEHVLAELDFIAYLRAAHYNALEPLPSKSGEVLVQKSTPWGEFTASAFKRVPGDPLSASNFEDEVVRRYGAALGQLHQLSSRYSPPNARRWTHALVFCWMEATLAEFSGEISPLNELAILKEYFSTLPIHPGNYGLVHYDFEPDNVFYDAGAQSCHVIDFDDAMYHWYVMDLAQVLHSLQAEIPPADHARKQALFLAGYRENFDIDPQPFAAMPLMRRFASLYRYTRLKRAIQERWDNEPEWLRSLRAKLAGLLTRDAQYFEEPIEVI
jgi:Ser/Thr protein kinase RdoA (MazF antagonist)